MILRNARCNDEVGQRFTSRHGVTSKRISVFSNIIVETEITYLSLFGTRATPAHSTVHACMWTPTNSFAY